MDNQTRKCKYCSRLIQTKSDSFINWKGGYYHSDCFIRRQTSLKKGAWTYEQAKNELDRLEKETLRKINLKKQKDNLIDFLSTYYEICYFPKYFFIKLESIYNGTFHGLTRPVSPSDLLEMWQTKIDYLNRVYSKNCNTGKKIEGIQRINYDLAILLSRYDKFLDWKEQQRFQNQIMLKEKQQEPSYIISEFHTVGEKENSIEDILDEI